MISIQTSSRNGRVVGAVQVNGQHEIMMISDAGTLVRTRVDEISVLSRNTQGVTLINLQNGERLIGLDKVESVDEGEEAPPPK